MSGHGSNGGAHFGKVGEMPSDDAKESFGEHLKKKRAPAEGEARPWAGCSPPS